MSMRPILPSGSRGTPAKGLAASSTPKKGVASLEARVKELEAQIATREAELGSDEEDAEVTAKTYIRRLHEYNECKDMTQTMLGKLADMDQTTLKAMHERYGLPLKEA